MSGIKQKIFFLFDLLKINDLFISLNKIKAIILCYHGISDDDFDVLKGYDERHITKSLFKEQMVYLRNKGYQFVTLTELMARLKKKEPLGKLVALTFDDGFQNVIDNAYPIMKEFGGKGCVYVISGLPGTGELLWTDLVESVVRNCEQGDFIFHFCGKDVVYHLNSKSSYHDAMRDIKLKLRSIPDAQMKEHLKQFQSKPLGNVSKEFSLSNWQQLNALDPSVLEVGCHTRTHPNCANFTLKEQFEEELRQSKADIEKNVGSPAGHFCYPGGTFNDETIKYLKAYGFSSATTIEPAFVDSLADPFKLKRIFVGADMLFFKASVSGSYYALSKCLGKLKGKDYSY